MKLLTVISAAVFVFMSVPILAEDNIPQQEDLSSLEETNKRLDKNVEEARYWYFEAEKVLADIDKALEKYERLKEVSASETKDYSEQLSSMLSQEKMRYQTLNKSCNEEKTPSCRHLSVHENNIASLKERIDMLDTLNKGED